MKFFGASTALTAASIFCDLSLAAPVRDELQRTLGISLGVGKSNEPYTPEYRDPYDRKVDSWGEDLQPLPYRNSDGATIQGPRNKDRERENPDLMRPPSTDHGDVANMRWSYADSHVRIEVSAVSDNVLTFQFRLTMYHRKAAGPDRPRFAS